MALSNRSPVFIVMRTQRSDITQADSIPCEVYATLDECDAAVARYNQQFQDLGITDVHFSIAQSIYYDQ